MGFNAWVLALAFLGLVAVHTVSAAKNYTVGGTSGWTNSGNINFTAEFAAYTVEVGDSVLFVNNDNINHTVLVMPTQLSYDTCDFSKASSGVILPPNYYVPILFMHTHAHFYVICGIHCLSGQKVTFSVVNATGTAPGSSPTPSPTGYTAPPPSTLTPAPASTPPASTPPAPTPSTSTPPAPTPPAPTPASTSASPPAPTPSTSPTASSPPPPPSSNVTTPNPVGPIRSEAAAIARFGWLTIAVVCVLTCCNIL